MHILDLDGSHGFTQRKISLYNTRLYNGEVMTVLSGGRFNDQIQYAPALDPLDCVLHDQAVAPRDPRVGPSVP